MAALDPKGLLQTPEQPVRLGPRDRLDRPGRRARLERLHPLAQLGPQGRLEPRDLPDEEAQRGRVCPDPRVPRGRLEQRASLDRQDQEAATDLLVQRVERKEIQVPQDIAEPREPRG